MWAHYSFKLAKGIFHQPPGRCPQKLPCVYEMLHYSFQFPAHILVISGTKHVTRCLCLNMFLLPSTSMN